MSDTPREDYELACEDAAREIVRFMDNLRQVDFEDSQAEEWGEGDDGWYWSATMVLHTDMPNVPSGRVYRFPIYCDSATASDVEFGESDSPWGDTREDVYRFMWIEEVTRQQISED